MFPLALPWTKEMCKFLKTFLLFFISPKPFVFLLKMAVLLLSNKHQEPSSLHQKWQFHLNKMGTALAQAKRRGRFFCCCFVLCIHLYCFCCSCLWNRVSLCSSAVLELTKAPCLCLPGSGVTGVCYHSWLVLIFVFDFVCSHGVSFPHYSGRYG